MALFTAGYGQFETQTQPYAAPYVATIILPDKSEIKGEIVSENDKEIVIRSATLGLLTFQKAEVKKIVYLYKKGGTFPNPMPARYMLGHSAFNVPKDGLYLHSFFGFISQGLMYGITDNLSAEGGIGLFTAVFGAPLYYGHLKYGFPIAKNLRGAVSIAHGGIFYRIFGNVSSKLTTLNALLTYGDKERNLTFGLGYNEGATVSSFVWILGRIQGRDDFRGMSYSLRGMTRVGKRVALITENWLPGKGLSNPFEIESLLLSGGLRIIWRKAAFNLLILINTEGTFEPDGLLLDFSIKL